MSNINNGPEVFYDHQRFLQRLTDLMEGGVIDFSIVYAGTINIDGTNVDHSLNIARSRFRTDTLQCSENGGDGKSYSDLGIWLDLDSESGDFDYRLTDGNQLSEPSFSRVWPNRNES